MRPLTYMNKLESCRSSYLAHRLIQEENTKHSSGKRGRPVGRWLEVVVFAKARTCPTLILKSSPRLPFPVPESSPPRGTAHTKVETKPAIAPRNTCRQRTNSTIPSSARCKIQVLMNTGPIGENGGRMAGVPAIALTSPLHPHTLKVRNDKYRFSPFLQLLLHVHSQFPARLLL